MKVIAKSIIILVSVLIIISFYEISSANTEVQGIIEGFEVFTTSQSPYIVTGDLIVDVNASLIIEAGVTLRFARNTALIVFGELIAIGSAEQRITFTSNMTLPKRGDYNGIQFKDSAKDALVDDALNYLSGSICRYCIIEYAKTGVYCDQASPMIRECSITQCSSVSSAALRIYFGEPYLINNQIYKNISNEGGNALYAEYSNILFKGNQVYGNVSTDSGSPLYLYHCEGLIEGNRIINNYSVYGSGGGIFVRGGSIQIRENEVIGNDCYRQGGGICLLGSLNILVSDNNISYNCSTRFGGGISIGDSALVYLQDNIIRGNTSGMAGGGMEIDLSEVHLTRNHISNNRTKMLGGGIHLTNSIGSISDCNISANMTDYAHSYGGGVYDDSSNIYIIDSRIIDNSTMISGGGLCLYGTEVTIAGNLIINNSSRQGGSAIYCEKIPFMNLTNNLILENMTEVGAAVYLTDINRTLIKENAIADNDSMFKGSGLMLEKTGCDIISNTLMNNTGTQISLNLLDEFSLKKTKIRQNNIINDWHGSLLRISGNGNINVTENYWGTTNPLMIIQALELEKANDLNMIIFKPYSKKPHGELSLLAPLNAGIYDLQGEHIIAWQPMRDTEITDYRVYYSQYKAISYPDMHNVSCLDVHNRSYAFLSELELGNYDQIHLAVSALQSANQSLLSRRIRYKKDYHRPMLYLGGLVLANEAQMGSTTLYLLAIAQAGPGYELEGVELSYANELLDLVIFDRGAHGDYAAGDGVFCLALELTGGMTTEPLIISMSAKDSVAQHSIPWPYLTVMP